MKKLILIFVIAVLATIVPNQNSNAQWTSCDNGYPSGVSGHFCTVIYYSNGVLYAGMSSTYQGIYRSINGASNWVYSGLNGRNIIGIISLGNNIFAGTDSGVYLSTNSGVNWVAKNNGLPPNNLNGLGRICVSGGKVFASIQSGLTLAGLYVSTNNGDNWTLNSFATTGAEALGTNGNIMYGSAFQYGVYKSANAGLNWSFTNNPNYANTCILVTAGDSVIVGKDGAFYRSLNGGINWTTFQTGECVMNYKNFLRINNYLFAACIYSSNSSTAGVYMSSNFGVNWINRNQGLPSIPNFEAYTLAYDGTYIYLGGQPTNINNPCIYKRSFSNIVGINPVSSILPDEYKLFQNYPNPFNPKTIISFQLPRAEQTILKIFDALGKEITTLINDKLISGTYNIDWDASDFSSGIYFARLEAGSYKQIIKMLMIK